VRWPCRSCSPDYICPPLKTISVRQGSRGRGLGWFVAGAFDTARLEPVDWLWLRETPVAIKDASESGVVVALLSSVSGLERKDLEVSPPG